jgi:hypothetical protein
MKIFKKDSFWFMIGFMIPIIGAAIFSYYLYANNLLTINI